MHEVESTLNDLMQREDGPFVTKLPREPGKREARFAHLFCGEPELQEFAVPVVAEAAGAVAGAGRIEQLEQQVNHLQGEVAELKSRLDRLSADRDSGH